MCQNKTKRSESGPNIFAKHPCFSWLFSMDLSWSVNETPGGQCRPTATLLARKKAQTNPNSLNSCVHRHTWEWATLERPKVSLTSPKGSFSIFCWSNKTLRIYVSVLSWTWTRDGRFPGKLQQTTFRENLSSWLPITPALKMMVSCSWEDSNPVRRKVNSPRKTIVVNFSFPYKNTGIYRFGIFVEESRVDGAMDKFRGTDSLGNWVVWATPVCTQCVMGSFTGPLLKSNFKSLDQVQDSESHLQLCFLKRYANKWSKMKILTTASFSFWFYLWGVGSVLAVGPGMERLMPLFWNMGCFFLAGFLVILDALTMRKIAEVSAPQLTPIGMHSKWEFVLFCLERVITPHDSQAPLPSTRF